MLSLHTTLSYYKRREIQEEILLNAQDREIAIRFGDKGFGKRPDVLNHPGDVFELARKGATSFHASEERWTNPLQLDPGLKKKEIEALRKGWDLVIDIDCPYLEYSKVAADLIVKALKHHGIDSISVKFSGNKGFHIGVPFEAFPEKIAGQEVSSMFPEQTRNIAFYLKEMTKNVFAAKIAEMEDRDISKIAERVKKPISEITTGTKVRMLDPEKILDIDTILISSRHLYRMPYSLHEKSGLASIPVKHEDILNFKKAYADPKKVVPLKEDRFLHREVQTANQAKDLFDKSIAEAINKQEKTEFKKKEMDYEDIPQTAIPEDFFPPCIQNILKGIEDGKKRSLFLLVNFLTSAGWSYDKIEERLREWNKKNPEPLRENLLVGQIRYHKQHKKKILPPNCKNQMYYKEFGVCKPDNLCSKIKNPINYSKIKTRFLNKKKGKKKDKVEKKKES
ncbi:hypothetical protein GF336_05595 [Candidatus Woesearchaeota archaeon]|nr:hypothetical protein [Candidatus Woesearchaeota archaeon]